MENHLVTTIATATISMTIHTRTTTMRYYLISRVPKTLVYYWSEIATPTTFATDNITSRLDHI